MRRNLKKYLQNKLINPMLGFLKQGITAEKLALCISLGAVLGLFPVVGITTLLCAGVAIVFRLNMAVIQLINYFVYPLQLIILIPIIRLGSILFGVNPVPYSITELLDLINTDWLKALESLWLAMLCGIVGWGLVAIPTALTLYYGARLIFSKMEQST